MNKKIAIILAIAAGMLALPTAADSKQNCNIHGCNIVVTAKGINTWTDARTPWVSFPWTVDFAGISSSQGRWWYQAGGPVGKFEMITRHWGGAKGIGCYALNFGASTNFWLSVLAPAGRKFSCHVLIQNRKIIRARIRTQS